VIVAAMLYLRALGGVKRNKLTTFSFRTEKRLAIFKIFPERLDQMLAHLFLELYVL
tara:strand:- start:280 stop:447 length:168 start_codon:yes stop_codon:yes gene_type:complete